MDASLNTVRNKLRSGEKLSTSDLSALEPLHDAIYEDDGTVFGGSGGSGHVRFDLEYLDRALLDGRPRNHGGKSSDRGPRLVRYVGMVQDMLDPEYYESFDDRGRSRHFGDHYQLDDEDCTMQSSERNSNSNNGHNKASSDSYSGYSECLAERIPLVVVPIPFASDWLFRGIRHTRNSSGGNDAAAGRRPRTTKTAVVSPVSDNTKGERKRVHHDVSVDDGESNMGDGDEDPTKQKTLFAAKGESSKDNNSNNNNNYHASGSVVTNATTTDWWPSGTCGTSPEDCPVLAKICYDQLLSPGEQRGGGESNRRGGPEHHQRPLILNDVVSLVGVLSMDPWEADFSGQQSSNQNNNSDGILFGEHHGGCYGCEPLPPVVLATAVPPPSRLPRLHVLSYRKFELDGLARRSIGVAKKSYLESTGSNETINNELLPQREVATGVDPGNESDSDDDSEVEWSGFPGEVPSSSSPQLPVPSALAALLRDGPSLAPQGSPVQQPWIRALWMCLLSEADRRRPPKHDWIDDKISAPPEIVRAGPGERAIGCVSLQLSTPDVASAKDLFRRLAEEIMPEICPVVAAVDLTAAAKGSTFVVPRKDNNGRLQPCPLQLPKGSVLLVYPPPPSIPVRTDGSGHGLGNTRNSTHNNKLESIRAVIRELVQHHRIPYGFEGGVTIPFEADYRVIVVTTQTQDYPCTISALTRTRSSTPMATSPPSVSSPSTRSCPTKPTLREILARGRSLDTNHDALKFSSILLERAQRDFLEKRRRCHESPSASSGSAALPGEDDFHTWLTLTKLQTKSRFSRCDDDDGCSGSGSHNLVAEGDTEPPRHSQTPTQSWEPSVEDWQEALQLDYEVRCMV